MEKENCNSCLDFISRRFTKDCNWISGNCYYFSIILKDRFPDGEIYYDVVRGHFIFQYDDLFYDWNGVVNGIQQDHIVKWSAFDDYDEIQKKRIVRDCIL